MLQAGRGSIRSAPPPHTHTHYCEQCVCVQMCFCLHVCIYMENTPHTDYGGLYNHSLRACWRVQHGGWLLQRQRSEEILLSLSPSAQVQLCLLS